MTKPTWRELLRQIIRIPDPKYNFWTSCITLYVQRNASFSPTLKDEVISKKKSGDIITYQALSILSLDKLLFV